MNQGISLRTMAAAAEEAVIDIVGVIGWDVGYAQLKGIIDGLPQSCKRVVFDIYSPGGDVMDGGGIVQKIGELSKGRETVARVQVAASMATLIAVACQKRTIAQNGRWLVHNPWSSLMGDAATLEKQAESLRAWEAEMADFYAKRTGVKTADEIRGLMDEERWMTPAEAKEWGFVQEVDDPFDAAAFATVRAELEAAGKWPQACKLEAHDAGKRTDGAGDVPPVVPSEPAAPADGAADLAAEYERGRVAGCAEGEARAVAEFGEKVEALKRKLADAEKLASRHQGEKDRLAAQLAAAQKASDDRAAALRTELDAATAKLRQFVSGALTFSPAVETWPEALAACGGQYAKAAEKYPEILKSYRAAEIARQNGR